MIEQPQVPIGQHGTASVSVFTQGQVIPAPQPAPASEFVPVTSWSRNRKHLARPRDLHPCNDGGRVGEALCDSSIHTDVYDQDWLDARRLEWFGKLAGSQLIVDLPPCKRCEKKAASGVADT